MNTLDLKSILDAEGLFDPFGSPKLVVIRDGDDSLIEIEEIVSDSKRVYIVIGDEVIE